MLEFTNKINDTIGKEITLDNLHEYKNKPIFLWYPAYDERFKIGYGWVGIFKRIEHLNPANPSITSNIHLCDCATILSLDEYISFENTLYDEKYISHGQLCVSEITDEQFDYWEKVCKYNNPERHERKFKIGESVQIKDTGWYVSEMDTKGNIWYSNSPVFNHEMSKYCGKIATVEQIVNNYYLLNIDGVSYTFGFCDWALKKPNEPYCEYCKNKKSMVPVGSLTISKNILKMYVPNFAACEIIIKYCPICGNKL